MGLFDFDDIVPKQGEIKPENNSQEREENVTEIQTSVPNDEIERSSYSKFSYKEIKKIRQKAKLKGMDIPYLKYPLTKPERSRKLFLILGILSSILLAASVTFTIIAIVKFMLPMVFQTLGVTNWFTLHEWDIFGLVLMTSSIVPIIVISLALLLTGLMISINVLFASITIKMFVWSKASIQEIAMGFQVRHFVSKLLLDIFLIVGVGGFFIFTIRNTAGSIGFSLVLVVWLLLVLAVIVLYLLVKREQNKAKQEFEELPQVERDDFIQHDMALSQVDDYRKSKGSMFDGVDF